MRIDIRAKVKANIFCKISRFTRWYKNYRKMINKIKSEWWMIYEFIMCIKYKKKKIHCKSVTFRLFLYHFAFLFIYCFFFLVEERQAKTKQWNKWLNSSMLCLDKSIQWQSKDKTYYLRRYSMSIFHLNINRHILFYLCFYIHQNCHCALWRMIRHSSHNVYLVLQWNKYFCF